MFLQIRYLDSVSSLTLSRREVGGRGGANTPPTSFSPVTSINVGSSPKNFLTFSFNHLLTLVQIFKSCTQCQSLIIKLEPRPPFKKVVFLVKSL